MPHEASPRLGGVQSWAIGKGIDPKQVLTVIEDGDEDRGEFIDRARALGQKVIPLSKYDARAFQAGDLVGWKSRTAIHNVNQMESIEDGLSAQRSLETIKLSNDSNRVFDKEALRELCDTLHIPKRNRHSTTA